MTVVEFQHVKPGKGGAFVRTKLKNFRTGAVLDRTFRADEKVPLAVIDKREMQYLYREGDALRLHGQRDLRPAPRRDRRDLGERRRATSRKATPPSCPMYDGEVVGVELPAAVELDRHRDRARRAGRPRVGRPQARDARDRARRAGAAVRRARRARSRSTPAPGSTSPAPERVGRRWRPGARPGSGHSASATSSRRAGSTADELLAELPAAPDAYARAARPRASTSTATRSTRSCASTPSTGRSSGCPRSTARCCASATYELGWEPDLPTAVVINEAVELAKQYSTKDSGRFVNGAARRGSPRSCAP